MHARHGLRNDYQPLHSPLCTTSAPLAVIEALHSIGRFDTFYIADLDAIAEVGSHAHLLQTLSMRYPTVTWWVDQGRGALADGVRWRGNIRPVVGTESLQDNDTTRLTTLPNNWILSLDITNSGAMLGPAGWFSEVQRWPQTVIVMTLARVGSGAGPDTELLTRFRCMAPDKTWIAAGGVRDLRDVTHLAALGAAGVLTASALHTGALDPADLAAAERL